MFETHRECRLCSLNESARNPGIPTRRWGTLLGHKTALLIVGQSPGYEEDKAGRCFIGWTGQLLDRFIVGSGLPDLCDIFLGNACRCCPPQGGNEKQTQIRACRPYLGADIDAIKALGYERIVILALGAKAVYSTLNQSSLNEALKQQGIESPVFEGIRVFCTNHPAVLHNSRQPGKVKAVEAHFRLLVRHLRDDYEPGKLDMEMEYGYGPPQSLPKYVSCDIETYGILKGVNQSVFHPIKSKAVDGVPFRYQVKSVSFGWEEDGKIRTVVLVPRWKKHRRLLQEWFRAIVHNGSVCLGQNLKFDLLYLYFMGDPALQYWIDPKRLKIDDTLLWMFLYYEQQPEKGLKELSHLFGIADYSQMKVTGKTGNATSDMDPQMHYYNCYDAAATLALRKYLQQLILERYGADSPKLGAVCEWVRNMVLWDVFDLEKNGSSFDLRRVTEVHESESSRCKELRDSAEEQYGIKFAGQGSDAPLRQLMLDCLIEANMDDDPRVAWTKSGAPSIGVENVHLVSPELPDGALKTALNGYQEFKERSKIVNTYTRPLLESPIKGIVTRDGNVGMVFPSWYPIPLYSNRGGSAEDKAGGQIQGRFSCQKPARQTEPPRIRSCACSRWEGGTIIEYDVNQDHIRMGALLSGDPVLMGAYTTPGESAHTRTALTLFPEYEGDRENFKKLHKKEYALGKTINFLVLFRGGAEAFRLNAMKDVGVELSIEFCANAIRSWYAKHRVYGEWQEELIARAAKHGYLELPTGWSRTFGLGRKAAEAQAGEVCNFMHQAPCAQVLQSSHYKAQHVFRDRGMRSVLCMQLYDALYVDAYPGEEEAVDEVLIDAMLHPPLLRVYEEWVGRTLPWGATKKIGDKEWDL